MTRKIHQSQCDVGPRVSGNAEDIYIGAIDNHLCLYLPHQYPGPLRINLKEPLRFLQNHSTQDMLSRHLDLLKRQCNDTTLIPISVVELQAKKKKYCSSSTCSRFRQKRLNGYWLGTDTVMWKSSTWDRITLEKDEISGFSVWWYELRHFGLNNPIYGITLMTKKNIHL